MGSSTALTDPAEPLVADASTIINLVASGSAEAVIAALPNRIVVVDVVPRELESGRPRGRAASDGLKALADGGIVDIVALPDKATPWFEELVIGSAVETLDDGEAATIACALALGGAALIDERKATRICAERFPQLRVACTVDLLTHPAVEERLGTSLLADAVFRALRNGRMGVALRHLEWVVGLIGEERAALCESLPRRVRMAPSVSHQAGDSR
jgi:predicted nucleic acid-binding protein